MGSEMLQRERAPEEERQHKGGQGIESAKVRAWETGRGCVWLETRRQAERQTQTGVTEGNGHNDWEAERDQNTWGDRQTHAEKGADSVTRGH